MPEPRKIHIIATGGTFDKVYLPEAGELGFHTSMLPDLIDRVRLDAEVQLSTPFLMDSLDMEDSHRQTILDCIQNADSSVHLIIHGTDTMTHTAEFLSAQLSKQKTNHGQDAQPLIVLTGAMIPARLPNSDALFNLGYAISQCQELERGIYIAMNGRRFDAGRCEKNKNIGRFQEHHRP